MVEETVADGRRRRIDPALLSQRIKEGVRRAQREGKHVGANGRMLAIANRRQALVRATLAFDDAAIIHGDMRSVQLQLRSSLRFLLAAIRWVGRDAVAEVLADRACTRGVPNPLGPGEKPPGVP